MFERCTSETHTVAMTWQWSGDQSMCWNTTFLKYQSGMSAPVLMKLDDPNINSATFTNLQCGTRYNFSVVVNTTTFINESNTASIHLGGCSPSITPSPTLVSTEELQSEYLYWHITRAQYNIQNYCMCRVQQGLNNNREGMQVGTCYEQISNKYTAIAVAIISSDIFIHFADKTAAIPSGSEPLNTSSTCFGGELSSTPSPSAGTPFGSEPVSASSTLSRGEPSNAHSLPVGALTFTESGTSSTPFTSTGTPEPTSISTDAVPTSNPSPHGPPSSTPRTTSLSTYFASASTGMPTKEEPTSISTVSELTSVLPPGPTSSHKEDWCCI